MSYSITTTPGIVMASHPRGEANRVLTILTRDAGTIRAVVQSCRALASKHRFHTQLFSHASFDCIRSREGWRLIGVHAYDASQENGNDTAPHHGNSATHRSDSGDCSIGIFSPSLGAHPSVVYLMSRMAHMMHYFIHGEEVHEALYEWVRQVHSLVQTLSVDDLHRRNTLEILAVARILFLLGYIDHVSVAELSLERKEDIDAHASLQKELIPLINHALHVAQM
jgi:hypothetical protein